MIMPTARQGEPGENRAHRKNASVVKHSHATTANVTRGAPLTATTVRTTGSPELVYGLLLTRKCFETKHDARVPLLLCLANQGS